MDAFSFEVVLVHLGLEEWQRGCRGEEEEEWDMLGRPCVLGSGGAVG